MSTALALHEKTLEVTHEQEELVKRTVAKDATPDELKLYFYDCQRQGVHPLDKLIHFTKRAGKYTPITSIDFMRTRAADSGEYAGNDDAVFVTEDNAKNPASATVTVYRMVQEQRCPFTATARWTEYVPEQAFMWKKMPYTMLSKCAEALALRKAFPRQLAGLYSADEMEQAKKKIDQEPPPEDEQGELHQEKPDDVVEISGIILTEKSTDEWVWYELNALTNNGEEKIFVKSPLATDSGRLANKIGHGVTLEVRPAGKSAKGGVFLLYNVLKVGKKVEQAKELPITDEDEKLLEYAPEVPVEYAEAVKTSHLELLRDEVKSKPIGKGQEIKIHQLQRERGMPRDMYYELLKRYGYEHAKEVLRGDYESIIKEIGEFNG